VSRLGEDERHRKIDDCTQPTVERKKEREREREREKEKERERDEKPVRLLFFSVAGDYGQIP